MKKILCYGDSNTFGYCAETQDRYPKNERWSGILGTILQNKYEVIEEGLMDRNAFVKNPKGPDYCSLENLPKCINSYPDCDIVILAVGTNDLQFAYNFNAKIIKNGLLQLINIIRDNNSSTKIIIIPPVKINEDAKLGFFGFQFNEVSIERSENTFPLYKQIAGETNCGYFDINTIATPTKIDGLHYEADKHKIIAEKISEYIETID